MERVPTPHKAKDNGATGMTPKTDQIQIIPNTRPITTYTKRGLDIVVSVTALAFMWPLFLLVALAIKLDSKGPIIFKQKREGINGNPFMIYKFRSMKVHTETSGVTQAKANDDRVTRVGRFIRKTSIDELPQFVNVLLGDMSVVGPRPHAAEHNQYYAEKIRNYREREKVKPGITGLAQISGSRGETETLEKMQTRINLDIEYIQRQTLWFDIFIILKTPLTLFSKNIY